MNFFHFATIITMGGKSDGCNGNNSNNNNVVALVLVGQVVVTVAGLAVRVVMVMYMCILNIE